MKASAVVNADFSRWYPTFRRCSLRSEVLNLPPAFIAYLHADGVKLPPGCTPAALRRGPAAEGEGWSESDSDGGGGSDDDSDGSEMLAIDPTPAAAATASADEPLAEQLPESASSSSRQPPDAAAPRVACLDELVLLA